MSEVLSFDIPLKPGVAQTFITTLSGTDYRFFLQWRDAVSTWLLDILDSDGIPLICGIPLVTGANLLEQFPDIDFGGELWVITDGAPSAPPSFAMLGVASHLRFIVGGTIVWNYS